MTGGVRTNVVAFPVEGGQCAGYLALPAVTANAPGVVVVQEWWGLTEHVKDVAQRFAAEGYVTLAPDLYRGTVTDDPAKAATLMEGLDFQGAVADILGAVEYLRRAGVPAIGVVGFCMGGRLALETAIEGGDALSAVVSFYGFNPEPVSEARRITAPVLALYGEADSMVPLPAAQALESELEAAGQHIESHIYPNADHAFFNDARPDVFNAEAAKDAWARTVEFLRRHLR